MPALRLRVSDLMNFESGFAAWAFLFVIDPPAHCVLRDQSSASSATLTVPFGVHRERRLGDFGGSLVCNGAELLPLFGSQIVVSEQWTFFDFLQIHPAT